MEDERVRDVPRSRGLLGVPSREGAKPRARCRAGWGVGWRAGVSCKHPVRSHCACGGLTRWSKVDDGAGEAQNEERSSIRFFVVKLDNRRRVEVGRCRHRL